ARHLARAQRPLSADLSVGFVDFADRRDRARLCRRPASRGLGRHPRAVLHLLLLPAFPRADAIDRQDRAAAAVADQHRRRRAEPRPEPGGNPADGRALTCRGPFLPWVWHWRCGFAGPPAPCAPRRLPLRRITNGRSTAYSA